MRKLFVNTALSQLEEVDLAIPEVDGNISILSHDFMQEKFPPQKSTQNQRSKQT